MHFPKTFPNFYETSVYKDCNFYFMTQNKESGPLG